MLSDEIVAVSYLAHLRNRAMREQLTGFGVPVSRFDRVGIAMSFFRNSEIYGENEPADYLYKLASETIRTCKLLADGRRQIGAFYTAGDLFGLEAADKHPVSAEAVVDSTVLAFKRNAVMSLAASNSALQGELWALMGQELQRARRHNLLLIKTALERVASFLLEIGERSEINSNVELPMNRRDIADHLGLTVETVVRSLRSLEVASAIALPTFKRIVLRDREILKRMCS